MSITWNNIKVLVNGTALPSPTDFSTNLEDLDSENSLRDIKTGVMHRDRIRADVLKITLSYGLEDPTVITQVLNLLSAKEFTVTLYDMKLGRRATHTMYCNKKSFQYINHGNVLVKGLKFDLTEC